MIFVNLIYIHFDILMSRYGLVNKFVPFQGCAKVVLQLHTARMENTDTLQTHPSISDFHEYHSNTHRHPPDIPQTPQDISREIKMSTDGNRHHQTPSDTERCCLSMSGGVCWRILSSVDILSSLEMSEGCLGDVWGVSGGIWVVFMETGGAQMCLRGNWVFSPCIMEP